MRLLIVNFYLALLVIYLLIRGGEEMDIASSLVQAANLMLTGMAVVFIFLAILIGAIKLMSFLVGQEPEPVVTKSQSSFKAPGVSNAHIAAISAAVHQYRNKQK